MDGRTDSGAKKEEKRGGRGEDCRTREGTQQLSTVCKETVSNLSQMSNTSTGVQKQDIGDLARSIGLHCTGETPGLFASSSCIVAPRDKTTLQRTSRLREAPLLSYLTPSSSGSARKLSMSTRLTQGSDSVPSEKSSGLLDQYGCGSYSEEEELEMHRYSELSQGRKGIKRDRSGISRVRLAAYAESQGLSSSSSSLEALRQSEDSTSDSEATCVSGLADGGVYDQIDDMVDFECTTRSDNSEEATTETALSPWSSGDWEEQDDFSIDSVSQDLLNA